MAQKEEKERRRAYLVTIVSWLNCSELAVPTTDLVIFLTLKVHGCHPLRVHVERF